MPVIQVSIVEGRDKAAVKQLAKAIAKTTHDSLGVPLNTIRVVVHQVPPSQWVIGDATQDDIDAASQAAAAYG